ncbi:unnamed protein product [Cochlearia groenlandica]
MSRRRPHNFNFIQNQSRSGSGSRSNPNQLSLQPNLVPDAVSDATVNLPAGPAHPDVPDVDPVVDPAADSAIPPVDLPPPSHLGAHMVQILEFLREEGHDRLPLLHPDKLPHTFCWKKNWKREGDQAKPFAHGWGGLEGSRAEKIANDYEARIAEQSQMSTEGRSVASKKKNRTFKVGLIETVPAASSSQAHCRTSVDQAEENARLKRLIEEQDQRYVNIIDFFSIIAMDSPNLARVMQERGVMSTQPPSIPTEQADAAVHELMRDLGIDDFDVDP